MTSTVRRPERRVALAVLLAVGMGLAGCGGSSDDEPATTTTSPPTSTTASTAASTSASTTSPTTNSTTGSAGVLDRNWVETEWTAGSGDDAGMVMVAGVATGLTSISGLCQGEGCMFGLDLLTDAPTGAAPAPGLYLLWSSELLGRNEDGTPNWRVADQETVTLAADELPALCNRVDDPTATALGTLPAGAAGGAVTPTRVWTVGSGGSLVTPAPSDFSCEPGDD